MAKLTAKQEMFCKEYVVDLNKTQAATRAGYSKKTAKEIGYRLFTKAHIEARIIELQALIAERVEVDADDIVRQLDLLRQANISEYVELVTEVQTIISKEGISSKEPIQVIKFKDFKDLSEDQLSCIESIKMGKNGIELKLHGKEWTIEKLNRHIGFYEEDHKQSKEESPTIIIQQGSKPQDLGDKK